MRAQEQSQGYVAPKRESVLLKQPMSFIFGSKISFTIGSTYLAGLATGLLTGRLHVEKPKFLLPNVRLRWLQYFSQLTTNSLRMANYSGAAAFVFWVTGYSLHWVFEDFFEERNPLTKNMIVGGTAGLLYKSTRGLKGAVVGGVLGASILGVITTALDAIRERDISFVEINFE